MLLTNDVLLAKKAKHLTTTAKSDLLEYDHDQVGYNYRLVNILAAMGLAQMEQLPAFLKRKQEIANLYNDSLLKIEGIYPQKITKGVIPNNWLHTVKAPNAKGLLQYLNKKHIQARPFWIPMNRLVFMKNATYITDNDVAGDVYSRCVSLPCSTNITDKEIETVIKSIKEFYSENQ